MSALDKAARALAACVCQDYDEFGEEGRDWFKTQARAVLMAVREHATEDWCLEQPACRMDDAESFTAVIDAILNPPRALSAGNQNGVVQG